MTAQQIEIHEARINALSAAISAINAETSLEKILKQLAEIAAHLVGARYAALGIPDEKGGMDQFLTYGMSEQQINRMDHYPLGRGLLGLLIARPESIRLDDMAQDERSSGLPKHHPHMTSFLGVPIMSKGKHLGSLYLCDRMDGKSFTDEDERMIKLLAEHAAVAIDKANLNDQLRKLAVVEERDRISMDLHDGIIQQIYAVGIKLELIRSKISHHMEAESQISEATSDLNQVIEDLREYIQNLKVGVDYSMALREELDEIAEGFRQVSSARLVMDIARGFSQLSDNLMHTIVQIVREALSNIVRHANANEVYVDLHEQSSQITLVISDNGVGFDTNQMSQGNGLANMQQRIWRLKGTVNVTSRRGRGTTITAIFPL